MPFSGFWDFFSYSKPYLWPFEQCCGKHSDRRSRTLEKNLVPSDSGIWCTRKKRPHLIMPSPYRLGMTRQMASWQHTQRRENANFVAMRSERYVLCTYSTACCSAVKRLWYSQVHKTRIPIHWQPSRLNVTSRQ